MGKTTLNISQNSKIKKVGKLALAIGFGVAIGATAIGRPAFAGGHGHDDRHHEERHRDHRYHDRGFYVSPAPTYYYAPAPDYYYAPEPEYYPPAYGAPPPPSEGINLFFGGRH